MADRLPSPQVRLPLRMSSRAPFRAPFRAPSGASQALALGLWAGLALTQPVLADGGQFGFCRDDLQKGWNYYCDPKKQKKKPAPAPAAASAEDPAKEEEEAKAPEPATEAFPATAEIERRRKELDEVRNKAVLDPTPENVQAYMAAQKVIIDQSATFADVWQRVLFRTPDLDANAGYPLSSIGGQEYQDKKRDLYEQALRGAAANLGFMVVVTDERKCALCGPQLDVIRLMQKNYGIVPLVVSKDGSYHPAYPDARVDTGQLKKLGLDAYPAPLVALVEPVSGAVEPLGAGLLTEDIILERIYLITQVPAGKAYETSPLAADSQSQGATP